MSMPSSEKHRVWYALDLTVAADAREAVEYALMEAGALGTETAETADALRITAYFQERPDREQVRAELLEALTIYSLPSSSVREMDLREIIDQDWLAEWKKCWQPVAVGERFIVAPPWSEIPAAETRLVIRIEPGMAFGTGTHETTRLCLHAIEKFYSGSSFLDVGTGTGILAIAAAKLDPASRIEACDTDEEAISIARENAELNGVANQIVFRTGSIDVTQASVDCVCGNLTTETILELLPVLISATCGRLMLSGILVSQVETVIDALRRHGIADPLEVTADGEWACVVV